MLRKSIQEAQVEAALQGHDLDPFQVLDATTGGFEARCKLCQMTTWVDVTGIQPVQDVTLTPRSDTGINERYLKDLHATKNTPKADIIVWLREFIVRNDFTLA